MYNTLGFVCPFNGKVIIYECDFSRKNYVNLNIAVNNHEYFKAYAQQFLWLETEKLWFYD